MGKNEQDAITVLDAEGEDYTVSQNEDSDFYNEEVEESEEQGKEVKMKFDRWKNSRESLSPRNGAIDQF